MCKNTDMSQTFIPPGISLGEPPSLYLLDEYKFQALCRDLFDEEDTVSTCDEYGTRGQGQYGIDLIAQRKTGEGIEVGQCKCYKDFPPREIRKASEKFFEHWERWSDKDVRRFILFVACDLGNRQRQDEILKQNEIFAKKGINYEAWSVTTIRNRLRSHSGIVSNYLYPQEHWVKTICGEVIPSADLAEGTGTQLSAIVTAVLSKQIEQVSQWASGETGKRLEEMRSLWRQGQKSTVISWLNDCKNDDKIWPFLASDIKAKFLRFEASLELVLTGDINRAKELAAEARECKPSDNDSILRSLIAYKEEGPEAAINILAGQEDLDSRNLRGALSLELGRIEEYQESLNLKWAEIEANAETHRIHALFYLVTKKINLAQDEIQKAINLEPSWESIIFASAVIDYFSALSPVAVKGYLVPWPEPVEWTLVKRDDESLVHLRNASISFKNLSKNTEIPQEDKERLDVWYLACLANDPEHQEDAINYCERILQNDPSRYHAIAWAISRNFGLDLEPSKQLINELVLSESASIPQIIALLSCYVTSNEGKEAIELLEKTKSVFKEHQAEITWDIWYAQSLAIIGKPEESIRIVDDSGSMDHLRHVRTMVLFEAVRKTNDWQVLFDHLENSYKETQDPIFLFQCCEFKARQQDWHYIADQANLLVNEIGTGDALRLVTIALFNDKQYKLCIELLDTNAGFFPQQKLPSGLRRLRVQCQQVLGLPDALDEAEKLALEDPTTANLIALVDLYIKRGDFKNLAVTARKLYSGHDDLSVQQLLAISQWLLLEDKELATLFWKKAHDQSIPDEFVGSAVTLGYNLGLDRELGPLMRRMSELGQQGLAGIQMVSINDFLSIAKQRQEHVAKLDEAYTSGAMPIHIIADHLRWPLVELYHGQLERNEAIPDPRSQFSLLARHGGRMLARGFPNTIREQHIYLDITAILLGNHIGILDAVENNFKTLHIPADLIPSLVRMKEQLIPQQPSRFKACESIIELAERGLLQSIDCPISDEHNNHELCGDLGKDWVAFFEHARCRGGYLVESLPLKKRDLSGPVSSLPEEFRKHIVNCRAVVEALRIHGPLSLQEYDRAIKLLGDEGVKEISEITPEKGKLLYCHSNIPEILSNANLLQTVCENFQVRIEKRELDRIRIELDTYKRSRMQSEWLGELIERIRKGIENKVYLIIPVPPSINDEIEKHHPDHVETENLKCLYTLLKFKACEGDVIWSDDRYLNGFARRDNVPIIGINEILKTLVGVEAINESDYYEKLARLRAANVRFIPLEKGEIIHYLQQARIDNSTVIETRELSILRRYMASCLIQSNVLQRPPLPKNASNSSGEIAFVISLERAIKEALIDIWSGEKDLENIKQAKSNWLMDNLYVDHLAIFNVTSFPRSKNEDNHVVATSLAGLISLGFSLESKRSNVPSLRAEYFNWLHNRVLRIRLDSDPLLLATIAGILKKALVGVHNEMIGQTRQDNVVKYLLQLYYQDLPKPVRVELEKDENFIANIGIKTITVINIDAFQFKQTDILHAVHEVFAGHEVSINQVGSNTAVLFQPSADTSDYFVFSLTHPVTGEKKIISDDIFGLLLESPELRRTVLQRNRLWFDLPEDEFQKVTSEILSLDDPWLMFKEVRKWRSASTAVYYDDLHRQLTTQQQLQLNNLLPPDVNSQLRHLRLASNTGSGNQFQEALDISAETLVNQESIAVAVERLAGLPISLSKSIITAIIKLPENDRRKIVKQILRTPGSPISFFHLVYILRHLSDESSAYRRLMHRVVYKFVHMPSLDIFQAFLALLKWVNGEMGNQLEYQSMPPHIRLALLWAHTHRLFSILIYAGAPIDFIQETFGQYKISRDLLNRNHEHWLDINHPRNIQRIPFYLKGILYSVGNLIDCLLDKNIRDIMASEIFLEHEGKRILVPSLLINFENACNGMNSFLGYDYSKDFALIFGPDTELPSPESLNDLLEKVLEEFNKTDGESEAWVYIAAILHGFPPSQNIKIPLTELIKKTNFTLLFTENPTTGKLAMQVASQQAYNLKDESLNEYLKGQLINIAKYLEERETREVNTTSLGSTEGEFTDMSPLLAEWALNISFGAQQSEDIAKVFADLLTHMVTSWKSMMPVLKPIVQSLCEELPISQAKDLWPLFIELRAN